MDNLNIVFAVISCVVGIIALIAVLSLKKEVNNIKALQDKNSKELESNVKTLRDDTSHQTDEIRNYMKDNSDMQNDRLESIDRRFKEMNQAQETKMENLRQAVYQQLGDIRKDVNTQMSELTKKNSEQLDKMRETVDEKLQSTLNQRLSQSFKVVNDNLIEVSKGLGEMQTLARGVGDLKKVLTNVKTRGNLGEIQLGAILDEMLAPEQFERNVNTKGAGREVVEFAVKLPGEDGNTVYLPIDSKFPGDSYIQLQNAYEMGDVNLIDSAKKRLISVMKAEAKDIREKYIAPPNTTEFGIMFLPSEGLYAEAVRLGMVEVLQHEYKVSLAGPTTMAALLNSLQMGFRTLAIQKRSGEVWNTLSAVKTEFGKFEDVLLKAQKNLNQANNNLESLIGVRSRAIQRKLKNVTEMDPGDSEEYLGFADEQLLPGGDSDGDSDTE